MARKIALIARAKGRDFPTYFAVSCHWIAHTVRVLAMFAAQSVTGVVRYEYLDIRHKIDRTIASS